MDARVGVVYGVPPEPPDAARTQWLQAGALTFGVEYREVDPERLAASFAGDEASLAEIAERSPEGGFTDEGVSIHVCGTDDGHEYLRFDVFDGEPHYHYVRPGGGHNHVVTFDAVAGGDFLPWAVERLHTRLADMLAEAGGAHLVDRLDPRVVAAVVDRVAAMAGQARAAHRAASGR